MPALRSIGLEADIDTVSDSAEIDAIPDSYLKNVLSNYGGTSDTSRPDSKIETSPIVEIDFDPNVSAGSSTRGYTSNPINTNVDIASRAWLEI